MIIYNGQDLDDIVPGLELEDIRVSPVSISPTVRDRAIQSGQVFVRVRDVTRTITATFAVLEQNREKRRGLLDNLTRWARFDTGAQGQITEPKPLSLPYHQGRLIDCICTSLPSPSTRQWWESKLSVTFTAYDPYFYDQWDKTANCGAEFTVGGTVTPWVKITRTLSSAASNQAYSDGHNTMTFSTIPKGKMTIDLNNQTAVVGSTNIMQYLSFASSFIKPRTGTMTISGTGAVVWRERWE